MTRGQSCIWLPQVGDAGVLGIRPPRLRCLRQQPRQTRPQNSPIDFARTTTEEPIPQETKNYTRIQY